MTERISGNMAREIRKHRAAMEGEPRERIYREHKGAAEALEMFVEEVSQVEHNYEELRKDIAWKERHSGYGRGDSMG